HELSTVKIEDGIISDIETQDGFTVEEGKDILDIQGKFLSPGFIDTHSHLVMYSNFRRQLNCSPDNVSSIEEMIEKFIDEKDEVLRDGWLRGYSYNEFELEEKRNPNRFDLDKVSTEIPKYVQHSTTCIGAEYMETVEVIYMG